jgi:hypothetical protein
MFYGFGFFESRFVNKSMIKVDYGILLFYFLIVENIKVKILNFFYCYVYFKY